MKNLLLSTQSIRLNSILLSLFCLLSIGLHSQKASAKLNSRCEQIREVRRLAWEEGLDGQNLDLLESRYCDSNKRYKHDDDAAKSFEVNLPSKNVSEDCANLNQMMQLTRISEKNNDLVSMIKKQEKIICLESSSKNSSFYYPNGRIAKLGINWYYPNGRIAKLGTNWYYPNGKIAKLSSN